MFRVGICSKESINALLHNYRDWPVYYCFHYDVDDLNQEGAYLNIQGTYCRDSRNEKSFAKNTSIVLNAAMQFFFFFFASMIYMYDLFMEQICTCSAHVGTRVKQ